MIRFRLFTLLCVMGAFLVACKKSDNTPNAFIRVIHASPNATALDLSPDGTLLVGKINYGSATNYLKVKAGGFNIRLNATGTSNSVLNGDVVLQPDGYYSILAADSVAKLKISVVGDDRTAAPSGKALIRFFHLVPSGGTYDLYLGASALFNGRSYFDQSTNASVVGYTAIDPGTFTFALRAAGGGSIVTTFPTANIVAGKTYTLIARGFPTGTGNQAILMSLFTDN